MCIRDRGVYRAGFEGARQYLDSNTLTFTDNRPVSGSNGTGGSYQTANGVQQTNDNQSTIIQASVSKATADHSVADSAIEGEAVCVERYGDATALSCISVVAPLPAANEVRIRQTAIGVNYIDVYTRTGYFNLIDPPAIPGMEAAGTVIDCGSSVGHLKPGDRVAYACAPPGAYSLSLIHI